VDWPNGMEGGRVHGHAEVRAYWTRQWGPDRSARRAARVRHRGRRPDRGRRAPAGARPDRRAPQGRDGAARLPDRGRP